MISQATDKIEYYVAYRINNDPWQEIKCESKDQSSNLFAKKMNELDDCVYELVEMLSSLKNCGLEQVTCSTGNN